MANDSYQRLKERLETTKAESAEHERVLKAALLLVADPDDEERKVELHLALKAREAAINSSLTGAMAQAFRATATRKATNQALTGAAFLPTKE